MSGWEKQRVWMVLASESRKTSKGISGKMKCIDFKWYTLSAIFFRFRQFQVTTTQRGVFRSIRNDWIRASRWWNAFRVRARCECWWTQVSFSDCGIRPIDSANVFYRFSCGSTTDSVYAMAQNTSLVAEGDTVAAKVNFKWTNVNPSQESKAFSPRRHARFFPNFISFLIPNKITTEFFHEETCYVYIKIESTSFNGWTRFKTFCSKLFSVSFALRATSTGVNRRLPEVTSQFWFKLANCLL